MSSSRTWRISSRNPPKCGATKKSAVDAGRRADRAGIEEAPDAPDIGDDSGGSARRHGCGLARRAASTMARAFSRLSASGFSVSRWQPWRKGGERHVAPRRGNDDVEHDVGPGLRRGRRRGRCRSTTPSSPNSPRPRLGARRRRDRRARRSSAVGLARGLEPGLAHGSATDEDGMHHPERSSRGRRLSQWRALTAVRKRFP